MSFYKFSSNDIFHNQIKAYPFVDFKIYDGKVYYNDIPKEQGLNSDNVGGISTGYLDLFQNNIDRSLSQKIYPFLIKDSSLISFKTVSIDDFSSRNYGDIVTGSYTLSASISTERFVSGQTRKHIISLKNTFNRNNKLSSHFLFSSSLGNKETQELRLISIPSIFYGSSIKKGSVYCNFYVSGVLAAQLVDEKRNGELRQKLPQDSHSNSVGGLVLYNEGFLMLTGSWSIHPSYTDKFDIYSTGSISPRWIDFSTTGSSTPLDGTNVPSSSFEIMFRGTNFVPTLTMFAHAPKGELNYSNNPTFISFQTGSILPLTSSVEFREKNNLSIKNIIKSDFQGETGSFQKTVYISKIAIYDKDKNIIGIAKLSSPIRKKESEGLTFKLKYDL